MTAPTYPRPASWYSRDGVRTDGWQCRHGHFHTDRTAAERCTHR